MQTATSPPPTSSVWRNPPFVDPYAYYVRYLGDNRLGLVHNNRVYTGMNYTEANNP